MLHTKPLADQRDIVSDKVTTLFVWRDRSSHTGPWLLRHPYHFRFHLPWKPSQSLPWLSVFTHSHWLGCHSQLDRLFFSFLAKMHFLLLVSQNMKQIDVLSSPGLHMSIFTLSGTHPFVLTQRREEPKCSGISRPGLQRGVWRWHGFSDWCDWAGQDLGGWGWGRRMGTLPGSPLQSEEGFVRE